MKLISKLFFIFILTFGFFNANAGFSDLFGGSSPKLEIKCSGEDCNIETGVAEVKDTVNGIETGRSLQKYIQDVTVYIISFISIIAVIYIIYAGFRILTGAGDDEVLKKQKSTILYVVIGIAVIWLAYPLTIFIIGLFNQ